MEETVLTVHHWTDRMFSLTSTRDTKRRFPTGHLITAEPCELRSVRSDVAKHLKGLEFPKGIQYAKRSERIFWEKATAIHIF